MTSPLLSRASCGVTQHRMSGRMAAVLMMVWMMVMMMMVIRMMMKPGRSFNREQQLVEGYVGGVRQQFAQYVCVSRR